jgi:hypothetical protein
MELLNNNNLITVKHSYSYLIKKDIEKIGKYLLKDEYVYIAVFDEIIDIYSDIYIYFKSIQFKKNDENDISYFYYITKAEKYFKYCDYNSISLNFDDVVSDSLYYLNVLFNNVYKDLKIDNDKKLKETYGVIFDKNVWIFMENKEKRLMKLNQFNI